MKLQGPFRERKILKRIFINTFKENSPMYQKYIRKVSESTGIDKEKVEESEPAKKFLRSLFDI